MSLPKPIFFISDLHLALEKNTLVNQFLLFLQSYAPAAQAIYILGDLFDTWIGDDDNTYPNRKIKRQLKTLVDSGTAVFLINGNRDFLLGKRFCQETGMQLLDDYAVIELNQQRVLLCHGDLLCTDDLAYQAFRLKSHTPEWQQNVLTKPLWLRLLAARWYRLRSFWHKRNKNQEIMDVNTETVKSVMRQYQCQILIHGHTHRPGNHEFELDGQVAQRLVLAQWLPGQIEYLSWTESAGFVRIQFN